MRRRQQQATTPVHTAMPNELHPVIFPARQALLQSESGPLASRTLTGIPYSAEYEHLPTVSDSPSPPFSFAARCPTLLRPLATVQHVLREESSKAEGASAKGQQHAFAGKGVSSHHRYSARRFFLVVFGIVEVRGNWSNEVSSFIRTLAEARARSSLPSCSKEEPPRMLWCPAGALVCLC